MVLILDDEECFIRMEDLASFLSSTLGSEIIGKETAKEYAENENRVQGLNCEKTRNDLGWEPQKNFEKAISDLRTWYTNINENHADGLNVLTGWGVVSRRRWRIKGSSNGLQRANSFSCSQLSGA